LKTNLLVINTLVYQNQLKAGVAQANLLKPLHELGVSNVEIRREFIRDFATELPDIAHAATRYGIRLFYSVPSYVYEDGRLMAERLEGFYREAQEMGCGFVKLNIGDYETVTAEDIKTISTLCEKYSISQTIENDQTPENGCSKKIKSFLESVGALGGNITLTFDVGNWFWTSEDPFEAARLLKEYVTYIHIKDVLQGTPPTAAYLGEGDLHWEAILRELPANVPVALEYPCDGCLPDEIQKLLEADI